MDIKFVDNKLVLPTAKIVFKQNIFSIVQIKGGVVVLLDVPMDSSVLENIYAFDLNGRKLWQVQPLGEFNPNIKRFVPYVGLSLLKNGNVLAANYYGLSYEISSKTGVIISTSMSK